MKIKTYTGFNNYEKEVTEKKYICLHTTGSRNVNGAVTHWRTRKNGKGTVSTPYIIDTSGAIHQVYSPQYWSYHSGSKSRDKQTIGIEIACAGVCELNESMELHNDINVKVTDYISMVDENGKQHFHERITEKQWKAVNELILYLSKTFNINSKMCVDEKAVLSDTSDFGVFTHAQVSDTKSDIPKWVIEQTSIDSTVVT